MFCAVSLLKRSASAVVTLRLPRTPTALILFEPNTAPAPPRPNALVSENAPAMDTLLSPAGPIDIVR